VAVLQDILATPISPELLPASADGEIAQKTEDSVGPYELVDFFLFHLVRHGCSAEKIAFLADSPLKAATPPRRSTTGWRSFCIASAPSSSNAVPCRMARRSGLLPCRRVGLANAE